MHLIKQISRILKEIANFEDSNACNLVFFVTKKGKGKKKNEKKKVGVVYKSNCFSYEAALLNSCILITAKLLGPKYST